MTGMTNTAPLAAIGTAARQLKLPTVHAGAARLAEIAVRERHTHLAYLAEILALVHRRPACHPGLGRLDRCRAAAGSAWRIRHGRTYLLIALAKAVRGASCSRLTRSVSPPGPGQRRRRP